MPAQKFKTKTPDTLKQAAEQYGVKLSDHIEYDPEAALKALSAQFNGEDPFGCDDIGAEADFGLFAKLWGKKFDRKFKKAAKGVAKVAKVVAPIAVFAVPGIGTLVGGSLAVAMASADKLLGDKKIKNAAKVISNTKALAALGDPQAKRGVMVLNAVHQIRVEKQVPPGKPAIPYSGPPIQPKQFTKRFDKAQVYNLATMKHLATIKQSKPAKTAWWTRVKSWFHTHLHGSAKPPVKASINLQLKLPPSKYPSRSAKRTA